VPSTILLLSFYFASFCFAFILFCFHFILLSFHFAFILFCFHFILLSFRFAFISFCFHFVLLSFRFAFTLFAFTFHFGLLSLRLLLFHFTFIFALMFYNNRHSCILCTLQLYLYQHCKVIRHSNLTKKTRLGESALTELLLLHPFLFREHAYVRHERTQLLLACSRFCSVPAFTTALSIKHPYQLS
jgi:hypothetical protein